MAGWSLIFYDKHTSSEGADVKGVAQGDRCIHSAA